MQIVKPKNCSKTYIFIEQDTNDSFPKFLTFGNFMPNILKLDIKGIGGGGLPTKIDIFLIFIYVIALLL